MTKPDNKIILDQAIVCYLCKSLIGYSSAKQEYCTCLKCLYKQSIKVEMEL